MLVQVRFTTTQANQDLFGMAAVQAAISGASKETIQQIEQRRSTQQGWDCSFTILLDTPSRLQIDECGYIDPIADMAFECSRIDVYSLKIEKTGISGTLVMEW